jgi:ligand-binding sensor domain-containing protein
LVKLPLYLRFCALLLLLAGDVQGQSGRLWRPEERVLVTSFGEVGALARDSRRVYVATIGGLVSYDPLTRVWGTPITIEDGYPANELPSALAVDEASTDVWLGTAQGSVYRYRTVPPRWDQVGIALGGSVLAIVVPPLFRDEVYIQTSTGWFRAGRISVGVRPLLPNELPNEVVAAARAQRSLDPSVMSFRATLGLDQRNRRWPLTVGIPGFTPETYFFGTRGAFIFAFDARRAAPEWYWFGAPSRGVSALAVTRDRVWVGADGSGPREGLSDFTPDLQRWTLHDPQDGAPRGPITHIEARGSEVFAASRDGVYRWSNGRWENIGFDDATSVAVAGSALWVGTRRGLYLEGTRPLQLLPGTFVTRVRAFGNDVWAATRDGLFQIVSTNDSLRFGARRIDELSTGSITDVAVVNDTVIAVASEGLWIRGATGWRGPVRLPLLAGLGRLFTARADGGALWIAGERGAARYTPATGEILSFLAPNDLPSGPVYDVAPADNFVWLATPLGALRLSWRR